jgi:hypothetical protein
MDPPPSKKEKISSKRTVSTRVEVPISSEEAHIVPPLQKKTLRKQKRKCSSNCSFGRTNRLQLDSMPDVISFAVDSSDQIQELLKKAKGDLSKLFSLIFPKLEQKKTLEELVDNPGGTGGRLLVDTNNIIEVLKHTSRPYGPLFAFQLLMVYGFEADMDRLSKAPPKNEDGSAIDLDLYNELARRYARQLLKLVEAQKKKNLLLKLSRAHLRKLGHLTKATTPTPCSDAHL